MYIISIKTTYRYIKWKMWDKAVAKQSIRREFWPPKKLLSLISLSTERSRFSPLSHFPLTFHPPQSGFSLLQLLSNYQIQSKSPWTTLLYLIPFYSSFLQSPKNSWSSVTVTVEMNCPNGKRLQGSQPWRPYTLVRKAPKIILQRLIYVNCCIWLGVTHIISLLYGWSIFLLSLYLLHSPILNIHVF